MRKRYFTQDFKVIVIGDNALCPSCYGTINKFVVIRVFADEVKIIRRFMYFDISAIKQKLDYVLSYKPAGLPCNYLRIFKNNFVRYA